MRQILMLLGAIFFSGISTLYAQIQEDGIPASIAGAVSSKVPFIKLNPDYQALEEQSNKKLVFAYPADWNQVFDLHCTHDTFGSLVVERLGFYSPEAKSLYFEVEDFTLAAGASFYIYTPDYTTIRGKYTSRINPSNGRMAFSPLPGDSLIVERVNVLGSEPSAPFTISRFYHDFFGIIGSEQSTLKSSGSCEVDIACFEGEEWQREKRGVCRILSGGSLCTGSLVNNTLEDARPFLLTANHCINNQVQADNSVFLFNYEHADCYGITESNEQSISGGQLRATTYHLDFALLELAFAPPPSYNPYYLGLNLNSDTAKHTTVIHHPMGDVKKISKDFETPVVANYGGGYDNFSHWKVLQWDLGTTEGGSSGSPLMNQNHLIIGTLTGGEATCNHFFNDFFSMIHLAWDAYPMPSQQLKYWLDPLGENPSSIRGYDPYAFQSAPEARAGLIHPQTLTGRPIDLIDLSLGNIDTWSWNLAGSEFGSSSLPNPASVTYSSPGNYTVQLEVTNNYGSNAYTLPDPIMVRDACIDIHHIAIDETLSLATNQEGDYYLGNNSFDVQKIAERFRLPTNDYWVHGIYIHPGMVNPSFSGETFNLVIWEGASFPGLVIYSESYTVEDLIPNAWNFLPFTSPIYVDGNFYAGIEPANPDNNSLILSQTSLRGINGKNTIYLNYASNPGSPIWQKSNYLDSTLTGSLGIKVRLCEAINSVQETVSQTGIRVWPNPARDIIKIESTQSITQIDVYNQLGALLERRKSINMESAHPLSIGGLSPGVYYIEIQLLDGSRERERFIKW
mgnify:CR=1 FL=1